MDPTKPWGDAHNSDGILKYACGMIWDESGSTSEVCFHFMQQNSCCAKKTKVSVCLYELKSQSGQKKSAFKHLSENVKNYQFIWQAPPQSSTLDWLTTQF